MKFNDDRKRIAVNTAYFHADPLIDAVRRVSRCGFQMIELNGQLLCQQTDSQLKKLKKYLRGERIKCSAINAVGDLIPVSLGNLAAIQKGERQNAIEHVKRCIDYAVELDSEKVVCDLGSSTEDMLPLHEQDELFLAGMKYILKYANSRNIRVVLMHVPGRRWIPWEGFPPDPGCVVERHVWPWKLWIDEDKLVESHDKILGKQIGWGFDCANQLVSNGNIKPSLEECLRPYHKLRLETVYLANHPGPYNTVWHRLLLHQPLWNGFYTSSDYQMLFKLLEKHHFQGEVVLQIREAIPCETSLKRSLRVLAW